MEYIDIDKSDVVITVHALSPHRGGITFSYEGWDRNGRERHRLVSFEKETYQIRCITAS